MIPACKVFGELLEVEEWWRSGAGGAGTGVSWTCWLYLGGVHG